MPTINITYTATDITTYKSDLDVPQDIIDEGKDAILSFIQDNEDLATEVADVHKIVTMEDFANIYIID